MWTSKTMARVMEAVNSHGGSGHGDVGERSLADVTTDLSGAS
jgi:hypothetical protein